MRGWLDRAAGCCASLLASAALLAGGPALASEIRAEAFRSAALQAEMRYTVYLPDDPGGRDRRYPVLYLLHGHGGDEWDWVRHGDLQATADRLIRCALTPPFIVVMPAGDTRWWVDIAAGAMQTALVHDLVDEVDRRWPTVASRDGRMIAGLSAGGYGTVQAVLQHPDRFAAAAAFSPAVYVPEPPADSAARLTAPFMDKGRFDIATWQRLNYPARLAGYEAQPLVVPLFIESGDHDHLGIALHSAALFQRVWAHQPQAAELRVIDGGHEWSVWRAALPDAVVYMARWLPPMSGAATGGAGASATPLPAKAPARPCPDRQ